jgi:ribosomal protein S16
MTTSAGAKLFTPGMRVAIQLARFGCANRPFYLIAVVPEGKRVWEGNIIEQV